MTEIRFGQVTTEKLLNIQKSYSTCKAINKNNDIIVNGLKTDKADLLNLSNTYKERYVETNKKLVESEESKPSRMTWFGWGFLTAAVLGVLGAFAISK